MTPRRIAALYAAGAIVGFTLGMLAHKAGAHGDAAWIQHDPAYISTNGATHCCGPADCERAPKGAIIETRQGFHVPITGQYFSYGQMGVYPSIDEDFWWCRWGGEVKCIFYPMRGA